LRLTLNVGFKLSDESQITQSQIQRAYMSYKINLLLQADSFFHIYNHPVNRERYFSQKTIIFISFTRPASTATHLRFL